MSEDRLTNLTWKELLQKFSDLNHLGPIENNDPIVEDEDEQRNS